MTNPSDNAVQFDVDSELSVFVLQSLDRKSFQYGIGKTADTAVLYSEEQSEAIRRGLEQAREHVEEFRHDLSFKELPTPHSLDNGRAAFLVFQLKNLKQPSDHLDDFELVASITAPNARQAQANVCCVDWHTLPECTLLVDDSKHSIRQCTFGDVIGIPREDQSVSHARIVDTPRGTELYPVKLEETPRHQPGDIGHHLEPSISQAASNAQRPQPIPPGDKSTRRKL